MDLKNIKTTLLDLIKFMMYWNWTWKKLRLPYWTQIDFICLDLDLKKTLTTLLNMDWFYDMLDLELWNPWSTSLEWNHFFKHWVWLVNYSSRYAVTRVWKLSSITCFLSFNIVLTHTTPSFGNFCISIYRYCMSLSHIPITHLCFHIFLSHSNIWDGAFCKHS